MRTRIALIATFVLATLCVGIPLVGTTASSNHSEIPSWNPSLLPLNTSIQPWQYAFYRQVRVTSAPTSTTTTSTTSLPVATTTLPPASPVTPQVSPPSGQTSLPTTTTPSAAVSGDEATLIAEWAKVAWCEEGGTAGYQADGPWFYSGSEYPDSLGINAQNWYSLGGTSDVSAAAQVAVAEKIQADPPDQGAVIGVSRSGCAAW
jgi:hypothetical protein